jgi:hypothetical protein
LPSWETAVAEDWLGKWAMNQMLINVSTRKFKRSVRLPEGGDPSPAGSGLSKSAVSRRFVALSAAHMKKWLASDLSGLDLLVVQIDGIHMDEDMTLVAAIGVDAKGDKHPLGLAEGATESAATVPGPEASPVDSGSSICSGYAKFISESADEADRSTPFEMRTKAYRFINPAVAPAFAELRYVRLQQNAGLRQQLGGTLAFAGQLVELGAFLTV